MLCPFAKDNPAVKVSSKIWECSAHMLVRLLKIVLAQVLQEWLGVLGEVSIDLAQPGSWTHPPQIAVEALAEACQHKTSQVLVLHLLYALVRLNMPDKIFCS